MAAPAEITETEPGPEPVLTPVLDYRFALKLRHVLITILFGTLLLFLNFLPLRNTDVWGHVLTGRWIGQHHALPVEDPFLPLAEGMRVVDTAWLSQIVLAQVERLGGGQGLSNLFALVSWLTYLLLARSLYLQGRSLAAMTAGTLLALAVGWSRVTTIRPEVFSLFCLSILVWLLVRREARSATGDAESRADQTAATPGWLTWLCVPPLFMAWANVHGTFVGGLIVLTCYALGRGVDVLIETRSVRAVLADRSFRQWTFLAELAAAATLVNPYGIDLWIEIARFGRNPVLRDVSEWNPMVLVGVGGREFVVAAVLIMFALRLSRRRVYGREVLLLLAFGWLAMTQVRMVGWFAPLAALVFVPHLANILRRWLPAPVDEAALAATLPTGQMPPGRSFRYTLLCLTLSWVFFAFSGFGSLLLGETPRSDKALYGDAPLALTEHLRASPPEGLVFNPQWWGDWLLAKGPDGLKPFMTTNMHLAPRQVWNDYQRISRAEAGFDGTLDRYRVTKVIVDKELMPMLASAMTRQNGWALEYEDEQAAVYRRAAKPVDRAPRPESPAAKVE